MKPFKFNSKADQAVFEKYCSRDNSVKVELLMHFYKCISHVAALDRTQIVRDVYAVGYYDLSGSYLQGTITYLPATDEIFDYVNEV